MNIIELVTLVIAWCILTLTLYVVRKVFRKEFIEVKYGLVVTIKGQEVVDKVLSALERPLRRISTKVLAIVLSVIFFVMIVYVVPIPWHLFGISSFGMSSILYSMFNNLYLMVLATLYKLPSTEVLRRGFTPLAPLIPGVTIPLTTFIYVIIGASIGILLHEIFHGVLAKKFNVKIKSGGFFALLFIAFGGFIEIDENDLKKLKPYQRLPIYSAGVIANLLIVYIVVIVALILNSFELTYLTFFKLKVDVYKLYVIDNETRATHILSGYIHDVDGVYPMSIYDIINIVSLYYTNNITTLNLSILTQTSKTILNLNVDKVEIYIKSLSTIYLYDPSEEIIVKISNNEFYNFLLWVYIMNITLAWLNALPAYPLDGYLYLDSLLELLGFKNEVKRRKTLLILSGILWSLFALTLYYSLKLGIYKFLA